MWALPIFLSFPPILGRVSRLIFYQSCWAIDAHWPSHLIVATKRLLKSGLLDILEITELILLTQNQTEAFGIYAYTGWIISQWHHNECPKSVKLCAYFEILSNCCVYLNYRTPRFCLMIILMIIMIIDIPYGYLTLAQLTSAEMNIHVTY